MNFVILKCACQNYLLHHVPAHHKAAHSHLGHSKCNNIVIWTNAALPETSFNEFHQMHGFTLVLWAFQFGTRWRGFREKPVGCRRGCECLSRWHPSLCLREGTCTQPLLLPISSHKEKKLESHINKAILTFQQKGLLLRLVPKACPALDVQAQWQIPTRPMKSQWRSISVTAHSMGS